MYHSHLPSLAIAVPAAVDSHPSALVWVQLYQFPCARLRDWHCAQQDEEVNPANDTPSSYVREIAVESSVVIAEPVVAEPGPPEGSSSGEVSRCNDLFHVTGQPHGMSCCNICWMCVSTKPPLTMCPHWQSRNKIAIAGLTALSEVVWLQFSQVQGLSLCNGRGPAQMLASEAYCCPS